MRFRLRLNTLTTLCILCFTSTVSTRRKVQESYHYDLNNPQTGPPNSTHHSETYLFRRSRNADPARAGILAECTCGMKTQSKVKIVGGVLSKENAWPWLAPLTLLENGEPKQFCGSTVIADTYVLTAGHCVADLTVSDLVNLRVLMGTNAIDATDAMRMEVSSIKIHPSYDATTLDNDIALIKLAQPITFSERVKPVCLKQIGLPHVGRTAIVSGWGAVKNGGPTVNKLREVKLKVIGIPECTKDYAVEDILITPNMMCATLPNKDSCQGDSGGPLFLYTSSTKAYNQVGIVSFGRGCANGDFPGVYTRVNRFIKWIKDNTADANYCQGAF